jgi:hypothetical protein
MNIVLFGATGMLGQECSVNACSRPMSAAVQRG